MGLREEKKAAMRAAIIETALELFRTVGFNRARVQDVIRRLNISEATFFNYFPTKQAVLDAAAQDLIDRSLDVLRAELDDDGRSVGERIDLVARQFAGSFNGDRQLAVLVATHTRMSLGAGDDGSEGRQLLTRLFASGQEVGEVRTDVPAQRLTDHYLAFCFTALTRWTAQDDEDDDSLEQQLLTGLELFWSGAGTRPPVTGRRRTATRHRATPRAG